MKNILILIFLSISTLSLGQEPINDGNKNFNHYGFSDSIQFYWPNGNSQYKFINIISEDRFGAFSGFTNELFSSQKTGEFMKGNKFRRKYGISTIIKLRDRAHKYFKNKEREIQEKNRALLKNKFYQKNNLNYSVLDILKTLLVDSTNIDTIKIKHGLLLGLGRIYFYSTITRNDNELFIQNFTGTQNHLESPFDAECEVPSLSKEGNGLITFSSSVFDGETFIALYKKNVETKKINLKKYDSFYTLNWRIKEIIWIDNNLIALKIFDGYGGENGGELINTRYLKGEIE